MSEQQPQKTPMPAPKGWLRWSGLGGASFAIVLVLALLYFVSGWAIKSKIERVASEAWGAQVDIAQLGLTFLSPGLVMKGLAVTDGENPMQNALVIEQVRVSLNLYHWVVGRKVIEEMLVTGVAFNQPRKKPGKLYEPLGERVKTGVVDRLEARLPAFSLPKADEVLARERLATLEQAEALQTLAKTASADWQPLAQRLPNADKLAHYQAELDQLMNQSSNDLAGLQARQQAFQRLKAAFEEDYAAIEQAQSFVRQRSASLSTGLADLRKLPAQDIARLMNTYSLDGRGLANFSGLIIGQQFKENLDLAMVWYEKAKPLIAWLEAYREQGKQAEAAKPARMSGRYIAFAEWDPQPDFIIKNLRFSAGLPWGAVQVQLQQVHFSQAETGQPIVFALNAAPRAQTAQFELQGTLLAKSLDSAKVQGEFKAKDYSIQNWLMLDNQTLPIKLQQATSDVSGRFSSEGLDRMALVFDLAYRDAVFDLTQSASQEVQRYVAPLFSGINQFQIHADIQGEWMQPALSVRSDLDRQLSSGLQRVLAQELQGFKQSLQQQLDERLEALTEPVSGELAALGLNGDMLGGLMSQLTTMERAGESQLSGLQKQLESEAQKRAQEQLKQHIKLPF